MTSLPENTKLQLPASPRHILVVFCPLLSGPCFLSQIATRATAATRNTAVLLLRIFITPRACPVLVASRGFPAPLSQPTLKNLRNPKEDHGPQDPPCMLIPPSSVGRSSIRQPNREPSRSRTRKMLPFFANDKQKMEPHAYTTDEMDEMA